MEIALNKAKGISLNIDGAIAAILLDMGFSPKAIRAVFILSRTLGISAHCIEEANEKPYRRLEKSDIEYAGNVPSHLQKGAGDS